MKENIKQDYYIAAWSGGKDSTYMVNELLKRDLPLDEVIFCDTGYEFEMMYNYIPLVEEYWKSKYPNIKVTKLNWGNGKEIWEKYAEGVFTKGQFKGKPRGFPFHMGMSWCTRELKVNTLKKHLKQKYKEFNVIEYVGIAFNEPDRITDAPNTKYPLFEWQITEDDIAQSLVEQGLHNPLYNHFHRTGCFTCPKQSLSSLYKIYKHYPVEWITILDMYAHYNNIGAGVNLFKGYTIEALVQKFISYEQKGKPTNYLDEEQPIGCMCK